MLYVSLCLSALLLVVVNAVALRRKNPGVGAATLLSAAAVVPLFCLLYVLPLINAVLVAIAGIGCCVAGARPRWFFISSLAVTVAAYGYMALASGVPEVREWDRLKAKYPMESLTPRLAYEDRPRGDADSAAHDPGRLSPLEKRIEQEEYNYTVKMRERSLERLHASAVTQFVNSPGFGPARMLARPAPYYIEVSDALDAINSQGPHPQPSPSSFSPEPAPGTVRLGYDPGLAEAHEANFVNFLHPLDFGYMRDREHVVGFRPHHFREPADAPKRWQVERLELVGLLKYDEPVVYLSENLPAMDELRDAPTRPLDAFESDALAELRRGEDLMVQDHPGRMRVLGSIRAVKQCLRCHHAERGDLLGAFSYRLVREVVKD